MDEIDVMCGDPVLICDGKRVYMQCSSESNKTVFLKKSGEPNNVFFYLMGKYLENDDDYKPIGMACQIYPLRNNCLKLGLLDTIAEAGGRDVLNEKGIKILCELVGHIDLNKNYSSNSESFHKFGLFNDCLDSLVENSEYVRMTIPDLNTKPSYPESVLENNSAVSGSKLSEYDIDLLKKYGLIESVEGGIKNTEFGEMNDVFKFVHGSRILLDDVVGADEEEQSMTSLIENSGDEPDIDDSFLGSYFKIAERTDEFGGYSIFFDDVEIPLVMELSTTNGVSNQISPHIFALYTIHEAYKNQLILGKENISLILNNSLRKSAKYGMVFLEEEYYKLFIYNDGSILPGELTEDILEVASDFCENGYGLIPVPKNLNYAFRHFDDIQKDLKNLKMLQVRGADLRIKPSANIEIKDDNSGISVCVSGSDETFDRKQLIKLSGGGFTPLGNRLFSEESQSDSGTVFGLSEWLYKWGLIHEGELNDEGKHLFRALGVSSDIIDN